MKQLTFDKLYDDLSEEEIMFHSLKYDVCTYSIEWHDLLQTNLISYDTPASWPAFFKITVESRKTQVGIFTSKKNINLAFIEYNKEK